MDKKLGILGGMGPLATAILFKKIIMLTDAKCDQEHIHILIDNNTSIPDRTSYIIGSGQDPRGELIMSAKRLEKMGADYLIMPCNTAHYFYKDIIKEINIPFLNMIEETAKFTISKYPNIKKIGLLATDGTCTSGIYDKYFENINVEVIKPSKNKQLHIMNLIYDIKKSGNQNLNLNGFFQAIADIKKQDVDIFILGCTELSSAYEFFNINEIFVDPLKIISLSAINFAGKKALV